MILHRTWLRRSLVGGFLLLVAALLVRQALFIEWAKVSESILRYQTAPLLLAVSITALSYLIYSSYDLLGRHYSGCNVSNANAMRTAFISYAFNQTLGSLLGSVGFRLRLYSQLGLKLGTISVVTLASIVTNWLGYIAFGGIILTFDLISLPADWRIGATLRLCIGISLLVAAGAYLLVCGFFGQRIFNIGRYRLTIPSFPFAVLQLSLSMLHWTATAAVIYVLLGSRVGLTTLNLTTVLAVLMISAVATVLTHVPAGLGILEFVALKVLGPFATDAKILASLLVFRVIYYLLPLGTATLLYLATEAGKDKAKHKRKSKPEIRLHRRQPTGSG